MKRFWASLLTAVVASAQQAAIAPIRPSGSIFIRPYKPVEVPQVRQAGLPKLETMVRGGALYLTAQDAVALALENNIDLEVARYNPIIASWRLERSEAGGSLPGVPSAASQAGTVAAGQGVSGSQQSAGVRSGGGGQSGNTSANASISQIGPVTQTLDPSIQETSTFSHTSTPQANVRQSSVAVLLNDTRAHSVTYQQGFLSGGSVTAKFSDNYLNENSPTNILNPSSATNFSVSAQHNLLRGFGVAVNARTITISKRNLETADLSFKLQVTSLVTRVLNLYYALAQSHDEVRARRNTVDVAEKFVQNVTDQIEAGSVAPPDLIAARAQLVSGRQAVVAAESSLSQQELQLKSMLSRNGVADPVLAAVRIVPVDHITVPASDDLPPLEEMVQKARASRADLAAARINLELSEISGLGTRNNLLPTLVAFGAVSNAGLAGRARVVGTQTADPHFVGGVGKAVGQNFRFEYPTERIGAFFQTSIGNRSAQADYAIDQLSLRQSTLSARKDVSQVEVDVMNYVLALQQARARYESAQKNRVLHQELLTAEQKKYALGASTPYLVIQQQRDLITAESSLTAALVSYSNARIALDQTLGRTLEANGVKIDNAHMVTVAR